MAPVQSPVRDQTVTEGLEGLGSDDGLPDMNADDVGDHDNDEDDDDDHVNEPMDMPDFDIEDDEDEVEEFDATADDAAENNISTIEKTTLSRRDRLAPNRGTKRKKGKKISRYGIEYPSLPINVVKRLATTCAKTAGSKGKISPDTLDAIMQATEWFFEQLGDDLSAYAKHAGRKTIDESDMIALMRRYGFFLIFFICILYTMGVTPAKVQMLIPGMIQTAADERFNDAICARSTPSTQRALAGAAYACPRPE